MSISKIKKKKILLAILLLKIQKSMCSLAVKSHIITMGSIPRKGVFGREKKKLIIF